MDKKDYIQELASDAISLLKEMIAIPSVSFSEDKVCEHISKWLDEREIEHERIGNNIVARQIHNPSIPAIMLCAHIDTVKASDSYDFDPFTPDYSKAAEIITHYTGQEVAPDRIVAGLGSNDDGASVVAMIAVYRYFAMEKGANIVLALTCEEERSGKGGMTWLWPEKLSKMESPHIEYAIIGEPTCMKIATSERGLLVIDATAYGATGHVARNEGENALYKAIEDISNICRYNFERISPRMGKVGLNVTQITAGTAHNVVPDRCDFVIDIRPTEKYTNEEIFNELQAICTSELKPRNLANCSSSTREGSPLQTAADILGIEIFSSPTTSDWMRTGCDAVKMGPGDSARSHRKNEFVFTEEIEKGIERYIEFIKTSFKEINR